MTRKLTSDFRPPPQHTSFNAGDNSAGDISPSNSTSAASLAMASITLDAAAAGSAQQCEQIASITHRMGQAGFEAPQSAFLMQQQQQQEQRQHQLQVWPQQQLLQRQQWHQLTLRQQQKLYRHLLARQQQQQQQQLLSQQQQVQQQQEQQQQQQQQQQQMQMQYFTSPPGSLQRGADTGTMLEATWLPCSGLSSDISSSSDGQSTFPDSQGGDGAEVTAGPTATRATAGAAVSQPSAATMITSRPTTNDPNSQLFEMGSSGYFGAYPCQPPQPLTENQIEATYQPVLDSTVLEPLDDTSLELLVTSLTQIGGDSELSQATSAVISGADGAYESDSESSSLSSNSPGRVGPSFAFNNVSGGIGAVFTTDAVAGAVWNEDTGSRDSTNATTSDNPNAGVVVVKKPKRIRRLCTQPNCGKRARSHGLCIAHGGGRRCIVEGCEKSSQGGNMCIKHGGGKRCSVSGCNRAAQTHGLCKAHGGGPRCQVVGCSKSSQGGGFCRTHGGGKRCAAEGCTKGTQRGDYCALHGGSRFCEVSGCRRNDRGGGLCAHHGGGKRCEIINCTRPCRRNGYCSTHLRLLGDEETGDEQS